jgi:ribose transport system substrate-binding protein
MKGFHAALLRTVAACATFALAGQAVADVTELPTEIQESLYNPALLDPNQPIGDSAYRDFIAKNPPPWKIGYASSYAGNTWRAGVMDRLQNEIIPKWQAKGLISEVIVTQSNLNDATQIQQMRQLVDQGVDAIIVCCSNPTALNPLQGRAGLLRYRLSDQRVLSELVGQLCGWWKHAG